MLICKTSGLEGRPTTSKIKHPPLSAGDAIDHLLQNIFTEAAGSRKGFPKVAMIITDGKSQDPVEEHARRLRNIGVEIFVLGMPFLNPMFLLK